MQIANMLTTIRNAQAVRHQSVKIPFSKIKFALAKILEKEGFLGKVSRIGKKPKEFISIELKYQEGMPVIQGLKVVSKPGQRIYARKEDIKPVKQGYGLAIISTSQGLMTDKEARKKKIGGEVLCEVW